MKLYQYFAHKPKVALGKYFQILITIGTQIMSQPKNFGNF